MCFERQILKYTSVQKVKKEERREGGKKEAKKSKCCKNHDLY